MSRVITAASYGGLFFSRDNNYGISYTCINIPVFPVIIQIYRYV